MTDPQQPSSEGAGGQPPVPPPPVPPAPPGYPPGYPPAQPPAYPAGGQPYGAAPVTSQNAIIGLILAIVSWLVCPVVPAIVGLVLARMSDREIAASGGRIGGAGLNTATRIVAWINIVVVGLGILVVGLLFALGVFAAGVNS